MTTLIVSLPHDLPRDPSRDPSSAPAQWAYVLTADGRTVASQSSAAAALLPGPVGVEVVAVVPVRALSWHRISLPRGTLAKNFLSEGNSPRLRAVLDGLLEEQLLDDPAHLHFALAPGARDDAPVWVAVCHLAWLTSALQALEAAGRAVSRIVPEFAPSTSDAHAADGADSDMASLHVMGTPDDAQLVFTRPDGLAVLPLSATGVRLANWPEAAAVVAEPAVAAQAEALFNRRVALRGSAERWLRASQSPWDLAQFGLANTGRTRSWKRASRVWATLLHAPRLRAARWAAVALVAINLIGLNAWAWAERHSLQAKRDAVQQVLSNSFPGVKVVVDAPVQMAREVGLLRQAAGGASSGDFESILASFSAVAPANTELSAIEYIANEVRLKGLNWSSAQAADVAPTLLRQGLVLRTEGDSLLIKAQGNP